MKRLIAAALTIIGISGHLYAATIGWSAGQTNGFSLADGTDLAAGNLALIGTFNISDAQIALDSQQVGAAALLYSHFIQFGAAHIGDGLGGIADHFGTTSSTADTSSSGLNIAGAQTYIWVLKSTNNSSVANSIATATQESILYLSMSANSNWAIPVQNPAPGSALIDVSNLTNATATSLVSGATIVVGTFPTGVSSASGKPDFGLSVIPAPEPGSAALALIGGTAMLIRRRRMI